MSDERERFYELLKDIHTVMMLTRTENGDGIGMRPMTIAHLNNDCDLWFFAGTETDAVDEVAADPRMSIIAQQGQESFFILNGVGQVLQDPDLARKLWKEPYKVWFPDGPDDPAIRIIHMDSKSGEFWDTRGLNKIKYLFAAARAYVTGDRTATEEGDQHGITRFS